ncbi:MAG: hypothetical protein GJU76_13225 [Gallionella sp.]|nr:hypothetical protein [Gallionella sp.]
MKIHKLLASVLLPALAILLAAFAQHILTIIWPGIREIRVPVVTVDSYFAVLSSGVLCFLAGYILRRRGGGRAGFVCAMIAPTAYLCLLLWALIVQPLMELDGRIAWLHPITIFNVAAAILPLLGLVLGWSYSGARSPRVALAHHP